jgi:glycerophosphoryl diester phosphodiesterase
MSKYPVTDPITDQEIAFAHLILSGIMTDRRAAEAVGLNPDTVIDTKHKPRVQAYMHEQRVAMHQEVVQKEAEQLSRKNLVRDQVLVRLWEIANLSHELTRDTLEPRTRDRLQHSDKHLCAFRES